jgi:nucleoid-associated protein YgaU
MWRHIAQANDLADPSDLVPGQVLQLPPLAAR